jgi:hypothetical protein
VGTVIFIVLAIIFCHTGAHGLMVMNLNILEIESINIGQLLTFDEQLSY